MTSSGFMWNWRVWKSNRSAKKSIFGDAVSSTCSKPFSEDAMKILVVGATSRVGKRVIPMLVSHGYIVRAMTRMPEKAQGLKDLGVEVVQGDLRDSSSLARACQGMDKVLD